MAGGWRPTSVNYVPPKPTLAVEAAALQVTGKAAPIVLVEQPQEGGEGGMKPTPTKKFISKEVAMLWQSPDVAKALGLSPVKPGAWEPAPAAPPP